MIEPRRLTEDSALGGLDRAVLRSASLDGPSPSARLAAQAALGIGAGAAASLAAGTASGATAAAATTATAKSALVATLVKIGVAVVAVSGAMVVAAPFAKEALRENSAPVSAAALVQPSQPKDVAPAPVANDTGRAAPIDDAVSIDSLPLARPDPKPAAAKSPRAAASTRLGEEVVLIEAARAKIAAGDSAAALAALDEYARAFGSGALAPEAAALRKLAKSIATDQNAPTTP